jgi:hypothetical protein
MDGLLGVIEAEGEQAPLMLYRAAGEWAALGPWNQRWHGEVSVDRA